MKKQVVTVEAGYFNAGVVLKNDKITQCAPILYRHKLLGRSLTWLKQYACTKGWQIIY